MGPLFFDKVRVDKSPKSPYLSAFMTKDQHPFLLMAPGPVPMPEVVKVAFGRFECHHRSPEFQSLLETAFEHLGSVFQTVEHCFILPATGTGGMEAALVNTLSPGDHVIVINGGKFGERWSKLGHTLGLKVDVINVPWGQAVGVEQVADRLSLQTKAILVQACETSTGVAHPVKDLGQLTKNHPALLLVDGITAVAAYDIPMDRWGVDVLIAGSQKGFMLPTGLSFLSFSKKAQDKFPSSQFMKSYFDLAKEKVANQTGKTRYSSPVQFTKALVDVCEQVILKDGLKNHFDCIQERALRFREKVDLPLFAQSPSLSLSCLEVPKSLSGSVIKKRLFDEFGISIVAGQDAYKDRLLRVGHMGAMTLEHLDRTAQAINSLL